MQKPPRGGFRARYWDRTSDLFRVREARYRCANRANEGYEIITRWRRDSNPCKRLCRPVPSLSATPPCRSRTRVPDPEGSCTRADDETRTRDPHLGKVMRYQLRYIRILRPRPSGRALGIDYPRSRDRPNQAALPGVSAATTACDTPGDHPRSSTSPISCTMNSCAARHGNPNMGVWRSWLARFLHTEEVVGSSPASPTTSSSSAATTSPIRTPGSAISRHRRIAILLFGAAGPRPTVTGWCGRMVV